MTFQHANDTGRLSQFLELAVSGSNNGLGDLLEYFRPAMLFEAEKMLHGDLKHRMSASDVVQDTMLAARKQFESFRGQHPGEFQQWLLQLFHSRLVDGIRRHRLAERRRVDREEDGSLSTIADPHDSPSSIVSASEQAERLMSILQTLPPESREIVRLRYVENRSFEQIAQTLGTSVPTAWRRFQDVLHTLHRQLH